VGQLRSADERTPRDHRVRQAATCLSKDSGYVEAWGESEGRRLANAAARREWQPKGSGETR